MFSSVAAAILAVHRSMCRHTLGPTHLPSLLFSETNQTVACCWITFYRLNVFRCIGVGTRSVRMRLTKFNLKGKKPYNEQSKARTWQRYISKYFLFIYSQNCVCSECPLPWGLFRYTVSMWTFASTYFLLDLPRTVPACLNVALHTFVSMCI